MLQRGLLPYDYEAPPGYDPLAYPDAGYLHEHGVYDGYDGGDNRCTPEYFHGVPEHVSEGGNLESSPHLRRRPSRRRHEGVDGRDVLDLRDHLVKRRTDDSPRRRTDDRPRKRHSSRARDSSRERPGRRGVGPLLHGRLASEVGNHIHTLAQSETESALDDIHGRGWSGYPQNPRHARSRLRERESRRISRKSPPVLSSLISQGSAPRRAESSQMRSTGATFSGPKTFAQIKEEKRRAMEGDGNSSGSHVSRNPRRYGSKDFEGPKPLNLLLKDKRRSVSANEDHQASEDEELRHNGTLEKQSNGYQSDYVYDNGDDVEEEEDEDALHEKLVHMLSS